MDGEAYNPTCLSAPRDSAADAAFLSRVKFIPRTAAFIHEIDGLVSLHGSHRASMSTFPIR